MLASKFCQIQHMIPRGTNNSSVFSTFVSRVKQPNLSTRNTLYRTFADNSRQGWTRSAGRTRRSLKEMAMEPAGDTASKIGTGAIVGGSVFGVGALCFYGLGLGSKPGIIDHSVYWPQYVRDRIKATYLYFGSSIGITAASAAAVFRSPAMLNLVTKNSIMGIVLTMGAMIGTGMVARGIPYTPGFGAKQMAWIVHSATIGAVLAPMCFLGGPLIIRAAWLTAGVVGGLSAVAVCAPSDKFLYMTGPLAIGLGVVFASALASMFLPAASKIGAGAHAINIYGGLLLFSAFLLYDTQRIIRAAEVYPEDAMLPFDPVNASISIYLDTINIFIRLLTIMSGGGGGGKRK